MSQKKVIGKNKVRQKKLKNKMVEKVKKNGGTISARQLANEAGYSPAYIHSGKIKKTKTWRELLDEFLPEDMLAEKHQELLKGSTIQHYVFPDIGDNKESGDKKNKKESKRGLTDEEIKSVVESVPGCRLIYIKRDKLFGTVAYFQAPDNKTQKDALDMAYKLRGTFAPEKHAVFATGLENLSDADLDRALSDQSFLINRFKKYDQAKTNDGGNSEPRETGKGARKPSTINKRTAKSRKSVK